MNKKLKSEKTKREILTHLEPPISPARRVVAADSDPSVETGRSDPSTEESGSVQRTPSRRRKIPGRRRTGSADEERIEGLRWHGVIFGRRAFEW
jgi:hypothetical protein